jgi:hypothetical protein
MRGLPRAMSLHCMATRTSMTVLRRRAYRNGLRGAFSPAAKPNLQRSTNPLPVRASKADSNNLPRAVGNPRALCRPHGRSVVLPSTPCENLATRFVTRAPWVVCNHSQMVRNLRCRAFLTARAQNCGDFCQSTGTDCATRNFARRRCCGSRCIRSTSSTSALLLRSARCWSVCCAIGNLSPKACWFIQPRALLSTSARQFRDASRLRTGLTVPTQR